MENLSDGNFNIFSAMQNLCEINFVFSQNNIFFSYEPELFPAVEFGIKEPKTSLTIHRTGKILFRSVKSEEHAQKAMEIIYDMVLDYAKSRQKTWR